MSGGDIIRYLKLLKIYRGVLVLTIHKPFLIERMIKLMQTFNTYIFFSN